MGAGVCMHTHAGINAPHLLHATSSSSQELPEQACSTSYSIQMAPAFSRRHYWTSNSSLHTAVAQPQGGSISDQVRPGHQNQTCSHQMRIKRQ
eukprot:1140615-Pelagomonas_calceolata.AAC.6